MESIEQARRGEDIAFAPFLPMAVAGYSVGGFDVNAGGLSVIRGFLPASRLFLPWSDPVGLDIKTGTSCEVKLQWLICDFGRRLGRYVRLVLPLTLLNCKASGPTKRSPNDVSGGVLPGSPHAGTEKDRPGCGPAGGRRSGRAKKLEKGGALEKEKRLRVEVQLAESQRLLDAAGGRRSGRCRRAQPGHRVKRQCSDRRRGNVGIRPSRSPSPSACRTAVGLRREFRWPPVHPGADEGQQVTKADFAPRIVARAL